MLLALNVHVLRDANFMSVVVPAPFASFVDLSPSTPPVTNVLSVVEGIPVRAQLQKFWQVLAA